MFSVLLVIALIGAIAGLISGANEQARLNDRINSMLESRLYNTIYELDDIETNLSKAVVVTNDKNAAKIYSELCSLSGRAEQNLAAMPISHQAVENSLNFINKLGGFCEYAMLKSVDGDLSEEDREGVEKLYAACKSLNQEMRELSDQLSTGTLDLAAVYVDDQGDRSGLLNDYWNYLAEADIDYPTLIYDGPFSDSELDTKPVTERKEISREEARNKAAELLGVSASGLSEGTDIEGDLPCYCFSTENGSISISKQGGLLEWYTDGRAINEAKLTVDQAQVKAEEFLKKLDYGEMELVWGSEYDNAVVFNAAPVVNDAVIYPDLVKIKVALDDGSIVGVEGRGYIINYRERELEAPQHSIQEASEKIFNGLKVEREQLCVIPLYEEELLCYEFTGIYNDNRYIVYVGANTLEEVNVMRVIQTDIGDLVL